MQNDNRKITIDDIARDLNISKTTVSRAISGKGRIGKETSKRVNDYIESHNYHPSAIARSLACSQSSNIAFVMNEVGGDLDMPYIQKCIWGATKQASESDFDVLICIAVDDDISQLKRLIANKKIDGALVARAIEDDVASSYLKEKGIPFVVAGSPSENKPEKDDDEKENLPVMYVDHNHVKACRELTMALIDSGIKKLSYIGGNTGFIVNKHRLKGFTDGLIRSGISTENVPIYTHITSIEKLNSLMEELLEKKPEAIVCDDDQICMAVLNYLSSHGIGVPGDIKVASFYNSAFLENYKPAITAIDFDAQQLGGVCCSMLINAITSGEQDIAAPEIGYKLMLKDSTK